MQHSHAPHRCRTFSSCLTNAVTTSAAKKTNISAMPDLATLRWACTPSQVWRLARPWTCASTCAAAATSTVISPATCAHSAPAVAAAATADAAAAVEASGSTSHRRRCAPRDVKLLEFVLGVPSSQAALFAPAGSNPATGRSAVSSAVIRYEKGGRFIAPPTLPTCRWKAYTMLRISHRWRSARATPTNEGVQGSEKIQTNDDGYTYAQTGTGAHFLPSHHHRVHFLFCSSL